MRAYERLLKYAVIPTASDERSTCCPSTEGQWTLARLLKEELRGWGASEVTLDENCYLFATLPANIEPNIAPTVGLIAHLDVSPDAPSAMVKPRVEHYAGGDIMLNPKQGIVMRAADYPVLADYVGCDLVVTDGTTLLGADDKAGIAEIMTCVEILQQNPEIRHGVIRIAFTPDEEIGRGADLFDVARFAADYAYTVDGGHFGEVEFETFNAAAAEVTVVGRGIHPGEAKGRMLNAQLAAMEFQAELPERERPEYTEGYEGFYHLHAMRGNAEEARLNYLLRDHDYRKLSQRMQAMEEAADFLNHKYGAGTVSVTMKESYRNMAEMIAPHPQLLEIARAAIRESGGLPISKPVRGGTDGSRLSFMGLPCPNLGTGSHNHHSRMEFACVEAMDQVVDSLVKIAEKFARINRAAK